MSDSANTGLVPYQIPYAVNGRQRALFLPPGDNVIAHAIQTLRWWELKNDLVLYSAAQASTPDGAFVDVGANIGTSTVLASYVFDRFVAFEMDPGNFDFLTRNVELNKLRCETHARAVSERSGEALHAKRFPHNHGATQITADGAQADFKVTSVALDDVDRTCPIAFLHVDTQGTDLKVLAGLRRYLSAHRPYIQIEFSPKLMQEQRADISELSDFIRRHRYAVYIRAPHQLGRVSLSIVEELFALWRDDPLAPWTDLVLIPQAAP